LACKSKAVLNSISVGAVGCHHGARNYMLDRIWNSRGLPYLPPPHRGNLADKSKPMVCSSLPNFTVIGALHCLCVTRLQKNGILGLQYQPLPQIRMNFCMCGMLFYAKFQRADCFILLVLRIKNPKFDVVFYFDTVMAPPC